MDLLNVCPQESVFTDLRSTCMSLCLFHFHSKLFRLQLEGIFWTSGPWVCVRWTGWRVGFWITIRFGVIGAGGSGIGVVGALDWVFRLEMRAIEHIETDNRQWSVVTKVIKSRTGDKQSDEWDAVWESVHLQWFLLFFSVSQSLFHSASPSLLSRAPWRSGCGSPVMCSAISPFPHFLQVLPLFRVQRVVIRSLTGWTWRGLPW